MNKTHSDFSEKPMTKPFLEDGTGLTPAGNASLPPAASRWVLYYKTDIQIGAGNPQTSYTITLIDREGVVSDEAVKTIEANSSTHTVTFKVVDEEGGTLEANYGGTNSLTKTSDTVQVPNGTTVTFTATPDPGWKLYSWTGVNSSLLNATLTVNGPKTVTVEFKKKQNIESSDKNAWQLLKKVVEIADNNAVITINGRIEATSGYNKGQIVIKNKSLTIEGKPGADSDILDANGLSRIFKVENGANLILKNLTLTGGKATGIGDAGSGGAIYAKDASTVNIENCIITGNEADTNGGGLNVEGTPTTITNCTFTGNTAKNGGGIYIIQASKGSVVTISGGTIGGTGPNEANKATGTDGNGGGIYVGELCFLKLENNGSTGCTIKGNTAQRGGGVYANKTDVSMKKDTQIAVDNDVYLDNTSRIKVVGTLSKNPAARITVPKNEYKPGKKVLDGNTTLLSSEHTKFQVTPKDDGEKWEVDSDGKLKKKN